MAAEAAAAQYVNPQAAEVAVRSNDPQSTGPALPAPSLPTACMLQIGQPAQASQPICTAQVEQATPSSHKAEGEECCAREDTHDNSSCTPGISQPQSLLQGPNAILRACQEALQPLGCNIASTADQEREPSRLKEFTGRASDGGAAPQPVTEPAKSKLPPIWQPPSSQQLALRQSSGAGQLPPSSMRATQRAPFPSGTFVYSSGVAQLKRLVSVQASVTPAFCYA